MSLSLLAAYHKRVKGRPDSEHGQALLRLGIVLAGVAYTQWITSHGGTGGWLWAIDLGSLVFSTLLFARILQRPHASPRRRALGAIHDNLAVTAWLYQAGPLGALYLFVYPFVTVGNGFRFGVKYLIWSGLLGAAGIASLVLAGPAWQTNQTMGTGFLVSHTMVTLYIGVLLRRMERMQRQLEKMATHDVLTGLPNRRLFMDRLSHVLSGQGQEGMACLYFDLDGFKTVNDDCGHEVGDRLLKVVAERLAGCVRRTDMPARLGGDEFAVVLDGLLGADQAMAAADRIIETVAGITSIDGHAIAISASVGVAFLPADSRRAPLAADALVRSADQAMYCAKKAGKGRYRFVESGASAAA